VRETFEAGKEDAMEYVLNWRSMSFGQITHPLQPNPRPDPQKNAMPIACENVQYYAPLCSGMFMGISVKYARVRNEIEIIQPVAILSFVTPKKLCKSKILFREDARDGSPKRQPARRMIRLQRL